MICVSGLSPPKSLLAHRLTEPWSVQISDIGAWAGRARAAGAAVSDDDALAAVVPPY
jgi:hypothetical protein